MMSLVQFCGEKTYEILHISQVNRLKHRVKWNGCYYNANVIYTGCRKDVQVLCDNLNNGYPVVYLRDINSCTRNTGTDSNNSERNDSFKLEGLNADITLNSLNCDQNMSGLSSLHEIIIEESNDSSLCHQNLNSNLSDINSIYNDLEFTVNKGGSFNSSDQDPYETDSGSDFVPSDESSEIELPSHKARNRQNKKLIKRRNLFKEKDTNQDAFIDTLPSEIEVENVIFGKEKQHLEVKPANEKQIEVKSGKEKVIDSSQSSFAATQYFESEIKIPLVPNSKQTKKYFCFYCLKLISKFPRHLENMHEDEIDVKKFLSLPKGSSERIDCIAKLRKEFLFIYNTNEKYNTGKLIPTRQPQQVFNRKAEDFLVCPKCKAHYSKSAFRRHFRKCCDTKVGSRDSNQKSRVTNGKVHEIANEIVKTKIIPVMRDDECVHLIRYDKLAIIYANKLTTKYRSQHHYSMIRSRLRLIGRLLIEIKTINKSCKQFSDLFDPLKYDDVIKAVNKVAGFSSSDTRYRAPATASALGTLFKKCGKFFMNMCSKSKDFKRKEECASFLEILEEEFTYSVNATVQENQTMAKRQKQIILPTLEDIKKLNSFLTENRNLHLSSLQKAFNFTDWKKLSEFTLTSIQVFNRRRPGEIQRLLIEDFKTYISVDIEADKELFCAISENLRQSVTDYVTFKIRGKLGRNVPVLLNKQFLKCVEILLKYRTEAEIPDDNPYLFALPGKNTTGFRYLSACNLLRTFSSKCGAQKPHLLRATELRKHIATRSIMLNLKDRDVTDLARLMGHEKRIHEEHYQQPVGSRDIIKMSTFLENAEGDIKIFDEENKDRPDENQVQPERTRPVQFDTSHQADSFQQITDNICQEEYQDRPDFDEANASLGHLDGQSKKRKNSRGNDCKEKRRSSSPKGYVKRASWGAEIKEKVINIFKDYVDKGTLPSIDHCVDVISSIPELHHRSPQQLKSFVSNQIKKKNSEARRSRRSTVYWTAEETQIMRKVFNTNLKTGNLPSLGSCQSVIDKYQLCRTRECVKAWVNNQIKRPRK